MAYPTAIGCGCLLGAGGAAHLHAAEWSMQPLLSWSADFDDDRNLEPGTAGSEQAILSADVRLQRAMESLQLSLEPHVDVRRYSDSIYGPGNDRSLAAGLAWLGERIQVNFNASIANQNTLTTELLETGIIDTNTRRRLETANGEVDLSWTEKRVLFTQLSYLGSAYSGNLVAEEQLPGYRYASAASGERFILSEHYTFSVSAFGDLLHSERAGDSSHEYGLQAEINYAHSEHTSYDLQVGESRRSLAGATYFVTLPGQPGVIQLNVPGSTGTGTNISASFNHNFELSTVQLNYNRSLVPYGNGLLVQRQQATATARHSLSEYLDVDFTILRIQNSAATVRAGVDRRFYENALAGLNWKVGETWTLRSEAGTSWSPPIGSDTTVHEWRAALTMTWKPNPTAMSR
jgi:hypothetical protein